MKFPISQRHASLRGSALEPEKHWPFLVLVTWSRGESLPATNGRKTDTRVDFGESLAPAAAAVEARGGAAGAIAAQRVLDQLAQARRAIAAAERRAGGDDEHVRVGEELDGLVRAGAEREDDEAEVELAALDERRELVVVG